MNWCSDSIIAGIKFTNADALDLTSCLHYKEKKFNILFGDDLFFTYALILGIEGFIGTSFNVFPFLFHRIIEAKKNDDVSEIQRLATFSINAIRIMLKSKNFLGDTKKMMNIHGLDLGPVRLPLEIADEKEYKETVQQLEFLGIDFKNSHVK